MKYRSYLKRIDYDVSNGEKKKFVKLPVALPVIIVFFALEMITGKVARKNYRQG